MRFRWNMGCMLLPLLMLCLWGRPLQVHALPKMMSDGTWFDAAFYAERYIDLKEAYGCNEEALWQHWLSYGKSEGRVCVSGTTNNVTSVETKPDGTIFDYLYYANRYPDLKAAFGYNQEALFNHYQAFGKGEGRVAYAGTKDPLITKEPTVNLNTPFPYYIRINRISNTVTVFAMDYKGTYTIPYKAFVCSAGADTPLGIFQMSTKRRWLYLVGGVYGQYTTRITGSFWFHSVPYLSMDPGDLDTAEYNKLGALASHGCVRLSVSDAKWIFDNCSSGTLVELYDDAASTGPLGKPGAVRIDLGSPNRGWDPTDPDPANPWNR